MIEATCHCGAVRLTADQAPAQVTDCNCSICRRLGALWAYYRRDQVQVHAAADATVAYVQGRRALAIHHCRTCGCTTHWAGFDTARPRMAINARLMDPAVLARTVVRHLDGADTWTYLDEP